LTDLIIETTLILFDELDDLIVGFKPSSDRFSCRMTRELVAYYFAGFNLQMELSKVLKLISDNGDEASINHFGCLIRTGSVVSYVRIDTVNVWRNLRLNYWTRDVGEDNDNICPVVSHLWDNIL
jgi:hypothetical protein